MSVDILGTSRDQCRSMVQYSFTSTETRRLVRMDSPGWPPRLSHSSWTTVRIAPLYRMCGRIAYLHVAFLCHCEKFVIFERIFLYAPWAVVWHCVCVLCHMMGTGWCHVMSVLCDVSKLTSCLCHVMCLGWHRVCYVMCLGWHNVCVMCHVMCTGWCHVCYVMCLGWYHNVLCVR